jgi:hypothetical protein
MKSSRCTSQLWNDFDSEPYRQPDTGNLNQHHRIPLERLAAAVNRNVQVAFNVFVIKAEFKHLPHPV